MRITITADELGPVPSPGSNVDLEVVVRPGLIRLIYTDPNVSGIAVEVSRQVFGAAWDAPSVWVDQNVGVLSDELVTLRRLINRAEDGVEFLANRVDAIITAR